MKTCIDCIPCIVGQGVHYAKKSARNPAQAEAIVNRMLKSLIAFGHELPPPVMAREIHAIAKDVCGEQDHYLDAKDNSTRIAQEILDSVRSKLEEQPDQFDAIVRLAIAGNIIDFGAYRDFDLNTARGRILEALPRPLTRLR